MLIGKRSGMKKIVDLKKRLTAPKRHDIMILCLFNRETFLGGLQRIRMSYLDRNGLDATMASLFAST